MGSIQSMDKSTEIFCYDKNNYLKVKIIIELMQRLFRKENEFYYKIKLRDKKHESD